MHSALVLTPVLFFIPLLAFLAPVLFRLLRPCQASELTLEWYESFDVSCYSPMQGLLASEDFQFLCRQPGFDPSLFRKLRRDRLRIFRQYLNRLIADFNRLQKLAALVISQSSVDQSALFQKLLSLRVQFWIAIMRVEASYILCHLSTHPVHVSHALQQLEAMSFELAALPLSKSLLARG